MVFVTLLGLLRVPGAVVVPVAVVGVAAAAMVAAAAEDSWLPLEPRKPMNTVVLVWVLLALVLFLFVCVPG
jgi:hypothetical protein